MTSRRRYVYDPEAPDQWGGKGAMVEVTADYSQPLDLHYVRGDTPGYQSPVTGLWVDGAKARRDDLKRTGSRPWEGMEQEKKHAERVREHHEQKYDRKLDESVRRAYHQLSPAKRRHLERP